MLPALLATDLTCTAGAARYEDRYHPAPVHSPAYAPPAHQPVPYVHPMSRAPIRGETLILGRVASATRQPLFGANVTIEALAISVGTNELGEYRIIVPASARSSTAVLRARLFGYAPQVTSVRFDRDTLVYDFTLLVDVNRLSQVVVSGTAEGTESAKVPFTIAQVPAGEGKAAAAPTAPVAPAAAPPTPLSPVTPPPAPSAVHHPPRSDLRGERYARFAENAFVSPQNEPFSTFGIDVDRASYSNVRRMVTREHQRPPIDAVRIEEMINYFDYDYAEPTGRHPFAVHTDVSRAPWNAEHLLVRVGLQARQLDLSDAPANNLVFLIDVSGSMQSPDKLPLLQDAFCLLAKQLREQDRVAIVVYAGGRGVALPSTSGAEKERIINAIYRLRAGGSTAGAAGIQLAYQIAGENFLPEGNNRVILATDGDFNVGVTDNAQLERMIEEKRREGTFLTVLGFGTGNIHDDRMEMLANRGNGNYAYVDTRREAEKVFVREVGGTLVTIARDVKLQVEFNPAVVARYRLIGYENRALAAEDFRDDTKDAGELGAGHTVTALYEVIPIGASGASRTDAQRYSQPAVVRTGSRDELGHVKLRYKLPTGSTSVPFDVVVANRVREASADFRFAQAVAAFGLILRNSEHRGSASSEMVLALARGALGPDQHGYRREFIEIVEAYSRLPGAVAALPGR
jgi:Ca-activated chloride channel family protein